MDSPWNKFKDGWSTFLTDLQPGDLTPQGEPLDFNSGKSGDWIDDSKETKDGSIFMWKKTLPDGKILVIFND